MKTPDTGIILAAGRGSRLGGLTDEVPKCLVQLNGTPLLEWQMRSLRRAGVRRIVVVCGYRYDSIAALGVETVLNPNWAQTNMVASLLCAKDLIGPPVIVSYADIIYGPDIARRISEAPGALTISYDLEWAELWSRRFADPLSDAESFCLDAEGRVAEIGLRAERADTIQGQYMGLLKLDGTALGWIEDFLVRHPDPNIENSIDMTSLLNGLIRLGHPIGAVSVKGGWCEIDSPRDLEVAHEWLTTGRLRLCGGMGS